MIRREAGFFRDPAFSFFYYIEGNNKREKSGVKVLTCFDGRGILLNVADEQSDNDK